MITLKPALVLKNFKGEPLKHDGKNLTLGDSMTAILGGQRSNPTLAWQLGKKFALDKEVSLKAEDVVFLKKEIEADNTWFAVVKGQLIELLDGPEK